MNCNKKNIHTNLTWVGITFNSTRRALTKIIKHTFTSKYKFIIGPKQYVV